MSARYHAPAVAYDFARPHWAGPILCVLGLALWASLLAWCLRPRMELLSILLLVFALLVSPVLLYGAWRDWPQGRVFWDGGQWQLELQGLRGEAWQSVQLNVGLDGGSWLWLRVLSASAAKPRLRKRKVLWIFVAQLHSPEQWGDLRRAVYSSIVLRAEQG